MMLCDSNVWLALALSKHVHHITTRDWLGSVKEPASILEQCRRIKEMETEGDRLYREAMARLFEKSTDAIFVIKAKEIIEVLEAATDAGDRVAMDLERIVLKNQ